MNQIASDLKQAQISPDCHLGRNVNIGSYVIIYPHVTIGDNVTIGDFSIIGQIPQKAPLSTLKLKSKFRTTIIKSNTRIGSHCNIYAGVSIGKDCLVADSAAIREDSVVGNKCIIGRGVMVEESVTIGNRVKIMTSAYITGFTTIENDVFIAPSVAMANDNSLDRHKAPCVGPTIKRAARIGVHATLLPSVIIGPDALVAAGAVVTKNVPARRIVMGIPARITGKVLVSDKFKKKNL